MYGMIHTAAREMTQRDFGASVWGQVKEKSGLVESHFISGQVYSDEITNSLIAAIAEVTKIAPAVLLEDFGYFWIQYTAQSSYKSIYDMYGDDLLGFISNLNRMHETIQVTMPSAETPIFDCLGKSETSIDVLYSSERDGLEMFVVGLFRGLVELFQVDGTIELLRKDNLGVVFRIALK